MKKRSKRKPATKPGNLVAGSNAPGKSRRAQTALAFAGIVAAVVVGTTLHFNSKRPRESLAYLPRTPGTLAFNKDIAPIIFQQCAPCHRPGQSAPFNLLGYAEVAKRARALAEVIERRYMPPWLPEQGYGDFVGERRLSVDEIGVIKQWVAEGTLEGKAADLPELPKWPEGWELGQPDLLVTLPSDYTLPSGGKDVYRNFVVPVSTDRRRYVKAVEFHPGNHKVVHHAFIQTDSSRQARHLVDRAHPPGFDGMQLPDSVQMPSGQMLGWQPGKPPLVSPDGLSWALEPNSDLILQMHMHPSGKTESVRPAIGFYFTDQPPTNTPFRINLMRHAIDIPPGAGDYLVENRYVLPVDVHLLRVLPHTHYLGKELQGYAILPDGAKKWLLLIKQWDFNWQGDYRYTEPVFLPKGTTLAMRFTYDNSAGNIHNPNQPPIRVKFGPQTTDEMAELWFQLLPRDSVDREILSADLLVKLTKDAVEESEFLLKGNPEDAPAHARLGAAMLELGRIAEALDHLHTAVRLRPDYEEAHTCLAGIYVRQKRLAEARTEFETVLRLKPDDFQAYGGLGSVFLMQGNLEQAEFNYQHALRINPDDPVARANLELVRKAKTSKRPGN